MLVEGQYKAHINPNLKNATELIRSFLLPIPQRVQSGVPTELE
jgi:hypothetical protein